MKKTKKIISLLLCILLIGATFVGCSANTYEATNEGYKDKNKNTTVFDYEINEETNEISVTKYTDSTERLVIVVPDEIDGKPVTTIADFSLFNAESIETIKIGKNVKEIGPWSMTNNQHLKEFVVDEENPYFCSVDGILFSKDMKTIVYYPPARNITFDKFGYAENKTTYEIPEGVETIRTKCFYECYYVEDIKLPSTLKTIEEKAFHRTAALNKIDLPEGLEYIGKDAFAYCFKEKENYKSDDNPDLPENTEIVIPSTVKEIGDYAFFNCEKVVKLTINAKEADMKLGKTWSPSTKGRENKDCEIVWANK